MLVNNVPRSRSRPVLRWPSPNHLLALAGTSSAAPSGVTTSGSSRSNRAHRRRQASRWIGDGVTVVTSYTVTCGGSLGFLTEEFLHVVVELISWVRPQALKEHQPHGLDALPRRLLGTGLSLQTHHSGPRVSARGAARPVPAGAKAQPSPTRRARRAPAPSGLAGCGDAPSLADSLQELALIRAEVAPGFQ
jgi:hypothetical protein